MTTPNKPVKNGVEFRIVLRRTETGNFEVDGTTVRVRPTGTNVDIVAECVAAIERWAKVVNRRMRVDSSIAPKITEAVQAAGEHMANQAVSAIGRGLYERFFAPKNRDE